MIRSLMPLLALATLAVPAPAIAEDFGGAAAESRLRGCLLASANSAAEGSLKAKVVEARAFCGTQIAKVQARRTAGLAGADKAEAIRALDFEIAQAVAQFTGLKND